MQDGEGPTVDGAISEIAALLAKAYQRCATLRLARPAPEALPSTEGIDNAGETSLFRTDSWCYGLLSTAIGKPLATRQDLSPRTAVSGSRAAQVRNDNTWRGDRRAVGFPG